MLVNLQKSVKVEFHRQTLNTHKPRTLNDTLAYE